MSKIDILAILNAQKWAKFVFYNFWKCNFEENDLSLFGNLKASKLPKLGFSKKSCLDLGYCTIYVNENFIVNFANWNMPSKVWMLFIIFQQLSVFRFSAWRYVEERGQFYYHAFTPEQPDLNYRNPAVVEEMKVCTSTGCPRSKFPI